MSSSTPQDLPYSDDRDFKSAVDRFNHANILLNLQRYDEAIWQYKEAARLHPNLVEAHLNCGLLQQKLGQYESSIISFTKAMELRPEWNEPVSKRGNSFWCLGKMDEAIIDYNLSITLNPSCAITYIHRGAVLFKQKKFKEAFDSYTIGLRLDPGNAAGFRNFAEMLAQTGDFIAAAEAFGQAYALSPSENFALSGFIHQKTLVADWSKLEELIPDIQQRLDRCESVAEPFGLMGFLDSEKKLYKAAEIYSSTLYPRHFSKLPVLSSHSKIRIGYLSGEFRTHAISMLLTGVLEAHNKNRFEIFAFDNGWDDGSEIRKRQEVAFKKIFNISELSDETASGLIEQEEIDILIDLNGFFGAPRQGILANKPAPVLVSYLGCPGTMGTDYVDYLIADDTVVPSASEIFFREKIVRLPFTYFCTDNKREISSRNFVREEFNLPVNGFVFCCFNNTYKILPETFDLWVRILKQVENSVLWLIGSHPAVIENLRKEALNRGLNPCRLIFANHLPSAEHLARHRLADLFLDTLPYNAHTTACDALWMGIPVLTLVGKTFPGRVAASLLKAIDMPELITATPEEYEAKAIDLATRPEKLAAIKAKLAKNRLTQPLFNTKLFTKYFEAALSTMYERHQAGLPLDHIEIKA